MRATRATFGGFCATLLATACLTGDAQPASRAPLDVIPIPARVVPSQGSFVVRDGTPIVAAEGEPARIAQYLADLVARTAAAPRQLPVGAIMALLGVPMFLVLLRRLEGPRGN